MKVFEYEVAFNYGFGVGRNEIVTVKAYDFYDLTNKLEAAILEKFPVVGRYTVLRVELKDMIR